MELTGEKVIDAPQARVYDALHDPVILRQAIPGVQTLTKHGDDHYVITATLKLGPLRPTFSGTLGVYNEDRPFGYSLRGESSGANGGGAVGGNAHVALAAVDPHTTNLAYHVTADVSGLLASFDGVKLDAAARTLIAEFFARLQSLLDGEPAEVAPPVQQPAPLSPASVVPGSAGHAPPELQFSGVRAMPYQPPRYPPQSRYPDFDTRSEALGARSESASTTDATGGLVAGEPQHDTAPPGIRHPGSLPQTPYRPTYRLGYEAADSAVYDGSGAGIGRWFMVLAGLAVIALLLNGGFSGVGF